MLANYRFLTDYSPCVYSARLCPVYVCLFYLYYIYITHPCLSVTHLLSLICHIYLTIKSLHLLYPILIVGLAGMISYPNRLIERYTIDLPQKLNVPNTTTDTASTSDSNYLSPTQLVYACFHWPAGGGSAAYKVLIYYTFPALAYLFLYSFLPHKVSLVYYTRFALLLLYNIIHGWYMYRSYGSYSLYSPYSPWPLPIHWTPFYPYLYYTLSIILILVITIWAKESNKY